MKKKLFALLVITSLLSACDSSYKITTDFSYNNPDVTIADTLENVTNKKAHIVFLYGQSNAEGSSLTSYLKEKDTNMYNEYMQGYDNVFINFVNHDGEYTSNYEFVKCTLGFGYRNEHFGPEVGISDIMSKKYPNETTFIIKWAFGGSSLRYDWLNNHHERGKYYNNAMDFSLKCLDYLTSKGYSLSLDGVCWMQGESDSWNNDEEAYYRDTIAFASGLRRDFSKYQKDIKWIDAAINDSPDMWSYPLAINNAKIRFSKKSSLNYFIDTNALGIKTDTEPIGSIDYAHYDSLSMVNLGKEFGKIAAN